MCLHWERHNDCLFYLFVMLAVLDNHCLDPLKSIMILKQVFCSPTTMCVWGGGGIPTTKKQFSGYSSLPYNSTQLALFCYLLGDSIWFHRLRGQSHKTAPPTHSLDTSQKPGFLTVLLTNQLQIGCSNDTLQLRMPMSSPGCRLCLSPTIWLWIRGLPLVFK